MLLRKQAANVRKLRKNYVRPDAFKNELSSQASGNFVFALTRNESSPARHRARGTITRERGICQACSKNMEEEYTRCQKEMEAEVRETKEELAREKGDCKEKYSKLEGAIDEA